MKTKIKVVDAATTETVFEASFYNDDHAADTLAAFARADYIDAFRAIWDARDNANPSHNFAGQLVTVTDTKE